MADPAKDIIRAAEAASHPPVAVPPSFNYEVPNNSEPPPYSQAPPPYNPALQQQPQPPLQPPPQGYNQPPPSYGQPPHGYGQQLQGFAQLQPSFGRQKATIILGAKRVGPASPFGQTPVPMQCPHCQEQIITAISYEIGNFTWFMVFMFFILGFTFLLTWLCCCIPCCISSWKDVEHSCPNCKQVLGRFNRAENRR